MEDVAATKERRGRPLDKLEGDAAALARTRPKLSICRVFRTGNWSSREGDVTLVTQREDRCPGPVFMRCREAERERGGSRQG